MAEITIDAPRHRLRGYLRAPDGGSPWPGVVVLHDALGQTRDSRRQVDWFAESGYLAVSPDLYSGGNKLLCIRAVTRDMLARRGAAFENIEATRAMLAGRADCTGKVGVIGFCMGGAFALLTAARGFDASSVNYGMVPENAASVLEGACPVIASFGARDWTLKGAAARLEAALQTDGIEGEVREYSGVGHSFMNDHGGATGWVMARIGMAPDEVAAADARKRILAFFHRHLQTSEPMVSDIATTSEATPG